MALKKSELYSSLWQSCDELRGGMDASQYKDYVLVLLFVKYVSDKFAGDPDALIEVPSGCRFEDLVTAKGSKDIGERINTLLDALAKASGISPSALPDFDDDAKLGKEQEKVDRLSNLIGIFESLNFGRNRAGGDDLLGDAYEFLMRHFAVESGKIKGQFYTPAEVSRIMARVIGLGLAQSGTQTIYDPTCGSGSLLIKAHDEAKSATGYDLTLYGQEMDNATAALAQMNMILHGCAGAEIVNANTLAHPQWKESDGSLKRHDFVVANPPFSSKSWRSGVDFRGEAGTFNRFVYGMPPSKNGDYAFLLHIIASMKPSGQGAVILPHGVLFRGHAEAQIRENLLRQGFIKGLIGLPPNLFYGTGIPACLVILDKSNRRGRDGLWMIDASRGFAKDGPKNRLRAQDVHRIVDTWTRGLTISGYSRHVRFAELQSHKFNLNLPRYIGGGVTRDTQNIEGHLHGGIPDADLETLQGFWHEFPTLRATLFEPQRSGFNRLRVPREQLQPTVLGHPEFGAFAADIMARFSAWESAARDAMEAVQIGDSTQHLLSDWSESFLAAFGGAPILDAYDLYQGFINYADSTLQDDLDLLTQDGWEASVRLRRIVDKKEQKNKEKADLTISRIKWKADLVPPPLVVARFYAPEQTRVEALEATLALQQAALDEHLEEHEGEEGLLNEIKDSEGKISDKSVKDRLKTIAGDPEYDDERAAIERYRALALALAGAKASHSDAQKALDGKVFVRYGQLSEAEVKTLVVEDKWLATLRALIEGETLRAGQSLCARLGALGTRYDTPLPDLTTRAQTLRGRVDAHLERMGFVL